MADASNKLKCAVEMYSFFWSIDTWDHDLVILTKSLELTWIFPSFLPVSLLVCAV